jgi:hypothetical protein
MALTVSCKRLPDQMDGGEDEHGKRTYKEVFEIDQTDAGALAAPVAMVIKAQSSNAGPDIVPLKGDNYSYGGTTDLDSYAMRYGWKRPKEIDLKTRIHATVDYGPADGFNPGRLTEPNPTSWPTEYWLEWTEEQVPVKDVRNVSALPGANRDADTVGPIINGAGEEPVDPVFKLVRYPILCCQKAYATLNEIVALNTTYQDTTNNASFFGAATTDRQIPLDRERPDHAYAGLLGLPGRHEDLVQGSHLGPENSQRRLQPPGRGSERRL